MCPQAFLISFLLKSEALLNPALNLIGIACSNSFNLNWVQVLNILVLLLAFNRQD